MIAHLAKFIDWAVLQGVYAFGLNAGSESGWKLAEALEFLNGPDFIPATSDPAKIEFTGPREYRFPSPRPCALEENNTVHGRIYRCTERWQERPMIILLDGIPSVGYHTGFPLAARRINRAGFNAVTIMAPICLRRRTRQRVDENFLQFARNMAQQVAEIRALTGWLLDEGCPSVGLVSFSFGGWAAGLTACSDARPAAVALMMPPVAWRMWCTTPSVVWRRVRTAFQTLRPAFEALDTTRLNLTSSMPAIPKENILLIKADHDLFANPQPVEDLWRQWGQPEIWRLPHGHVSALFMPGLTARLLDWFAPRLETCRTSIPS